MCIALGTGSCYYHQPEKYHARCDNAALAGARRNVAVICAMLAVAASLASAQQAPAPFHLQEATIAGIHAAFAAGRLTCAQLTRLYLDRIEAYNLRGPALRAIITVNPKSMETAAEMDRQYRANPSGAGSLHCVPIVLKDNFNTFDMPTTGGNVAMRTFAAAADAFTVARIRKAGALILAKANMSEFARGGMSLSSLGGQVLNPYDLTRTPGGSSGGTGAAIAANFAAHRYRQRYGPVDPLARVRQQSGGHPADARPGQPERRDPEQPDAGRGRPDRTNRHRRSAVARRDGRL